MQAIPELSLIARNRIALGARTPDDINGEKSLIRTIIGNASLKIGDSGPRDMSARSSVYEAVSSRACAARQSPKYLQMSGSSRPRCGLGRIAPRS